MISYLLLKIIDIYKKIKHIYPRNCCRFSPTCSEYAEVAIKKHGALKGTWLSIIRLLKCNQLFKPGYDPVP